MVVQQQRRSGPVSGRGLLLFGLAAAAVASIGVGLLMVWPDSHPTPDKNFEAGAVDEFELGSVTTIDEGRFHLVRTEAEEFLALSWRHPGQQACTVPWLPNFVWPDANEVPTSGWFRDPCTGSTFDREGHKVFGPAARDMDRYYVSIVAGRVIVDTGRYICGFSPPEATCVPAGVLP